MRRPAEDRGQHWPAGAVRSHKGTTWRAVRNREDFTSGWKRRHEPAPRRQGRRERQKRPRPSRSLVRWKMAFPQGRESEDPSLHFMSAYGRNTGGTYAARTPRLPRGSSVRRCPEMVHSLLWNDSAEADDRLQKGVNCKNPDQTLLQVLVAQPGPPGVSSSPQEG